MRILILSEYLLASNNGGAEVYALKLAEILKYHLGYDVELLAYNFINRKTMSSHDLLEKYKINSLKINSFRTFYVLNAKLLFKIIIRIYNNIVIKTKMKNGDIFINCSINRFPGGTKTKNIHIIHFPAKPYNLYLPLKLQTFFSFLDDKYKKSYLYFLSNSQFTNGYLKKYWGVDGKVIYPPCPADADGTIDFSSKKKQIVIVGRIVSDKKIIEMINAYLKAKIYNTGYRLLIIGNSDIDYSWYLKKLEYLSRNNNGIVINTNVTGEMLKSTYLESMIFWHGKGYGIDEKNPMAMEHFGMTTVEAMSYGCVPVVINKAGQQEIVEHGISGYLWDTLEALITFTLEIIHNENLRSNMAINVKKKAKLFSVEQFTTNYSEIIKSI
jgi:glycosyltransferase involved in cell wall biosynthesis